MPAKIQLALCVTLAILAPAHAGSVHCQVESHIEGWASSTETIVLRTETVVKQADGAITRERFHARSTAALTHRYFAKSPVPIKRQGIVSDSDW